MEDPTSDVPAAGPARRRRVLAVVGVLLLASVVSGMALYRSRGDQPAAPLTVGWDESEGHPACVYNATDHTVEVKLEVEGRAPRTSTVRITVTAYADENTSQPVGSSSRSVRVEGTMHQRVRLSIPVEKPAHVDEDGVAAYRLAVKY